MKAKLAKIAATGLTVASLIFSAAPALAITGSTGVNKDQMQADLQAKRDALKAQVEQKKTEMQANLEAKKTEMQAKMAEKKAGVQQKLDQLKQCRAAGETARQIYRDA